MKTYHAGLDYHKAYTTVCVRDDADAIVLEGEVRRLGSVNMKSRSLRCIVVLTNPTWPLTARQTMETQHMKISLKNQSLPVALHTG